MADNLTGLSFVLSIFLNSRTGMYVLFAIYFFTTMKMSEFQKKQVNF